LQKLSPTLEITRLLIAWTEGDQAAFDQLVPIVHDELRRLARGHISRERDRKVAQTTELVNEAYLRLVDCSRVRWQDRDHFFSLAGRLMRRVLADLARSRLSEKRGGGLIRITFDESLSAPTPDWLALDEALNVLEAFDARKSRMVELRFFAGLDVDETARVLGISPETVHRDWRFTRSWLRRELSGAEQPK
jgi:RNA polymerase sigma-70 factor, ECF subfamily